MGKLEGKVAVITGGSSGMALETAKLFVEEGAYVFITGRRQEVLDETVKAIGRNVTGVRADSANLADLDRLYEKVKSVKGYIDIVFASAGNGEVGRRYTQSHRPRYPVHRPKGAAPNARWRLDHPQRLGFPPQGISWNKRVRGCQGGGQVVRAKLGERFEGPQNPGEQHESGSDRLGRLRRNS